MSFGPVCVRLLWLGSVSVVCNILLHLLYEADEDFAREDIHKIRKIWILYSVVAGVALMPRLCERTPAVWMLYGVLAIYLILCSVVDAVMEMVYDFCHYIGVVGGGLYLLYSRPAPPVLGAFLLYVTIQWFIFRTMYGPADVIAFIICAMYLAAEGRMLLSCLMHMAVTFLLLGVVQGGKRNISSKGDLKHPVALLPYITVAFFLII